VVQYSVKGNKVCSVVQYSVKGNIVLLGGQQYTVLHDSIQLSLLCIIQAESQIAASWYSMIA
jgi:hypothetical protein